MELVIKTDICFWYRPVYRELYLDEPDHKNNGFLHRIRICVRRVWHLYIYWDHSEFFCLMEGDFFQIVNNSVSKVLIRQERILQKLGTFL